MMQLDNRKKEVLHAIVDDYVSTNEPVGSKSLIERHSFNVSSATLRNDMAELQPPQGSWPSHLHAYTDGI